ncbi:DNA helicase [Lapillicoccus sp.]|uniref:DNA helicase n=1 Tax=Lapillicoccus sp. TaxID=1909287 RepID=UPI003983CF30
MSPVPEEPDVPSDVRPSAPERGQRVAAAVAGWQRHLADVGGRNTLLWYEDLPTGTLDLTTAHPGGVSMLLAGRPTRLSDLVREPAALAGARTRVRTIRAKTVALAEQRGVSTGFLAVGMARWEMSGGRSPRAPVLLRTCALRPTGSTASDFDVDLGDEVDFNPVLEHYLRSVQGLEIDGRALAEMATVTSGFDPYPVYAALGRLCRAVPGFSVSPRLLVSTFPHAKLDMVADLAGAQDLLAGHDVVAALAGDPDAEHAVRSSTPDPEADPDPDPTGERLVLDADSGQGSVVDAVRRGASLVVHAAPGTGVTQTIANLVAALASEGKSVLLVAEQRAALTDAIDRLEQVGLGSLVLDAAEAGVNRRGVLRQLVDALEDVADRDRDRPGDEDHEARLAARLAAPDLERLTARRDRLRDHVNALHEVREPWGVSAHEAQWAIAELGSRDPAPASRVRLDRAALADISRSRLAELARELREAADLGAWSAQEGSDPWYGAHITTDEEAERAADIVTRLSAGDFDQRARTLDGILDESSLPPARRVGDWDTALRTMSGVRDTLEVFRPGVFDVPLDEHVAATASRAWRGEHEVTLGAWSRSRVRRQARRMLRPGRPPEDLHAELIEARTHRTAWQDLVGAGGRPEISPRLDEAQEVFDTLHADLGWLGERLASTAAGGDVDGIPLAVLRQRLRDLAARLDRLAVLPQVVPALEALRASGMGGIVDDFARRSVTGEQVTPELEQIWWVSLVRHITDVDERYGKHDGSQLRRTVADYVATDHQHLGATAGRVRAATDRAIRGAVSANRSEVAALRAEAAMQGRPHRVRDLLNHSTGLFLAVKPCWAMSPLAVAEVVPAGRCFDVVIIDGASQVAPAEAISAISRGRQVVAFGDQHQSPPTGFTTAVTEPSGPAAVPDRAEPASSIFDALAEVLPRRTLGWHYGSVDERLIGFANTQAYAGSLVTFPGTSATSPVTLERVDGSAHVEPGQDSAAPSTEVEVTRVVALVLEHARSRPRESLGVVTLSALHAERITQALDVALRPLGHEAPLMDFFDVAEPQSFFVRSMNEVAGSVRDAIILSVGYGKTPHGRVIHSFPELAVPGAERTLITATTRARRRLTVVSSLSAGDLEPERLRSRGGQLLRALLDYAARGGDEVGAEPRRARDPLMADLADRLRREGLTVAEDVGSSLHKVDLVVAHRRDPSRFLVVVEGDGPGYAGLRGTRERDRLWVEHLERLGWRHVRIFSTDLYRDPAQEVARVVAATRGALPPMLDDEPEGETTGFGGSAGPGGTAGPGGPSGSEFVEGGRPDEGPPDASGSVGDSESHPAASESEEAPEETREEAPEPEVTKKRRRVFRRSKADQTLDDTDAGWGERADESAHDRWLREQRPPHWD